MHQILTALRSPMAGFVLAALALSAPVPTAQGGLKLTYNQPAAKWTEALPLGNGRIGAMVFGGTGTERIQINESTLWGGGPHDYANPEAGKSLAEVRRLVFEGRVEEAERLTRTMMGRPKLLMPYQPFCDLHLQFPGHGAATGYRRELRLDDAISAVSYRVGGVTFRREIFLSFPDQVLVIRLTADKPGQESLTLGMTSPQPETKVDSTSANSLRLTGQIQPRKNPDSSWTASWDQPGERFAADLRIIADGGTLQPVGQQLQVAGANSVTILFSNATSFRNYEDITGDALGKARESVRLASTHSYKQLLRRHLDDFQPLFARVRMQLGDGEAAHGTTAERIRDFAKSNDPQLAVLYYQFGRYLLLASSRRGGQPANLQGIWNEERLPPWSSKWTTNINLEMNYWPADSGDLWETEEPLWSLIEDLTVTGHNTARLHYNASGWVLHHNADLWRATTPVDGVWGLWPVGGVWLANQMWDHYEFSQDREFLRRRAYPAMKGAARFVLDTLVQSPDGTRFPGALVTNPSVSPENQYILNGRNFSLTYGATMDLELIKALFANCRQAVKVLGGDDRFLAELQRAEKQLPPLQIGKRGQLQEWIEDYAEPEPQHRHVSHLWALYPGNGINLDTTPDLAAAAKRTLELRTDAGTGWSKAWKISLWARLRDGEHAYGLLRSLISESTLPNMFDVCPPFQIDGNFGGAAAIAEMLVQSRDGEIRLLPAIPNAWASGSVEGLRVRGGAKVGIEWRQGKLTGAWLQSTVAGKFRVNYKDDSTEVTVRPGESVRLGDHLQLTPDKRTGKVAEARGAGGSD